MKSTLVFLLTFFVLTFVQVYSSNYCGEQNRNIIIDEEDDTTTKDYIVSKSQEIKPAVNKAIKKFTGFWSSQDIENWKNRKNELEFVFLYENRSLEVYDMQNVTFMFRGEQYMFNSFDYNKTHAKMNIYPVFENETIPINSYIKFDLNGDGFSDLELIYLGRDRKGRAMYQVKLLENPKDFE